MNGDFRGYFVGGVDECYRISSSLQACMCLMPLREGSSISSSDTTYFS